MLLPLAGTRLAPSGVEGESGFATRTRRVTDAPVAIRRACARDADAIHELIDEHLADGHLLPPGLGEVLVHVHRFVIAVQDDEVLACAELAPLSHAVAEVRSMVVTREARGRGLGGRTGNDLIRHPTPACFEKV